MSRWPLRGHDPYKLYHPWQLRKGKTFESAKPGMTRFTDHGESKIRTQFQFEFQQTDLTQTKPALLGLNPTRKNSEQ